MLKNISSIKDCYGCGVCAFVCPKKIINIELNRVGFYEPVLSDMGSCTNCGLCISICSYSHKTISVDPMKLQDKVSSHAAWSNDSSIRNKCSSGGIGFELGTYLIKQGYKACGVRYNHDLNRAEHFIASTTEEFIPSIGSKYIQSYTLTGFSQLNRKEKFFVTGTPCQIDSLRRYIRKMNIEDNFVLMDFFCHGVPSMNLWKKYTKMAENKIGQITYASWRSKQTGWHDSWAIGLDGIKENQKIDCLNNNSILMSEKKYEYFSLMSKGDLFYNFFLGDVCLGKACYLKCKYKYDKSAADIRIGDLWGEKYKHDEKGVSAILTFTERGKDVVSMLTSCTIKEEDMTVVTEGQMKLSPKMKYARKYLLKMFSTNISINYINKLYQYYLLPSRIVNKVFNLVKLK